MRSGIGSWRASRTRSVTCWSNLTGGQNTTVGPRWLVVKYGWWSKNGWSKMTGLTRKWGRARSQIVLLHMRCALRGTDVAYDGTSAEIQMLATDVL